MVFFIEVECIVMVQATIIEILRNLYLNYIFFCFFFICVEISTKMRITAKQVCNPMHQFYN